jgi:hypothetical protein
MDHRITVLFAVLLVSGCANPLEDGNNNPGTEDPINTGGPSGNGLEIESFRVADETLDVGERTVITLNLKNYHGESENVSIEELSLYNTGQLDTNFMQCSPPKDQLEAARGDVQPEMECRWEVNATQDIGGFDQKQLSLNLYLKYNSALRTSEPMEVQFKEFSEINSTRTISHSEDNGEVEVQAETETPIAVDDTRTFNMKVSSVGDGRVEGNYSFEFTPDYLFTNCDDDTADSEIEKKPVVGNDVEMSCTIDPDATNTRRLFVSTHYKYIKEPSLSITLVNQ